MTFSFLSFFVLISLFSCNKNETFPELKLIQTIDIGISEPSGICVAKEGRSLYVVSDDENRIVEISTDGEFVRQIIIGKADYEGITFDSNTGTIWLADEQNRLLLNIDTLGYFMMNVQVPGSNQENSGIEGLSYNHDKKEFYLIIEKDPGKLIIVDSLFNIKNTYELDFAKDYSGCFYDSGDNALWIVSEQSMLLVKCNLEGIPTQRYTFSEKGIEGIAISGNKIFMVSDGLNRLFIYDTP
ncbi:MAG: SdiA-regulated domain-containing protein [Bacteroidota bacterium]|nr:SdiA-regulated domain-containing protein [Bacteroidota bacterium]